MDNTNPTTLIIDFRGQITPEVENPPARYRATIAGAPKWFHDGNDAVEYIDRENGDNLPSSIFDEWAGHTVSDADAICGFPRLSGPPWGKAAADSLVASGWAPTAAIIDGKFIDSKDVPLAMGNRESDQ